MIRLYFLERMLSLVECLDVQWGLMKSMEQIESLILLCQSRALQDLPLGWQQVGQLQLQKFNLQTIYSQHLIKLSTRQLSIDTDLVVNSIVESSQSDLLMEQWAMELIITLNLQKHILHILLVSLLSSLEV